MEARILETLEGFLARLAVGEVRQSFVLKGGVLLAAFGSRRPTKDVDLAALDLAGDTQTILGLVRQVLVAETSGDDGIEFAGDTATVETIREGASAYRSPTGAVRAVRL